MEQKEQEIMDKLVKNAEKIDIPEVRWVQYKEDNVLLLSGKHLIIYNLKTSKKTNISIPQGSFYEFKFDENSLYLRSDTSIQKFDFLLK